MSDRTIKLLLIDDDPIFRLGVSTALDTFPDLQVIAQADTVIAALQIIAQRVPDLIILDLSLGSSSAKQTSGWQLCQQLKNNYPQLRILLFTTQIELQQLLIAKEFGIEGYCPKGIAIAELVQALRQVASGEIYWQSLTTSSGRLSSRKWISRIRQSGLQQIEASLATIKVLLENPRLSLFDKFFWRGRQRELLAARWLVNQLLPVEIIVVPEKSYLQKTKNQPAQQLLPRTPSPTNSLPNKINSSLSLSSQADSLSTLLNSTLAKINLGLENRTGIPLEIDILQLEKKQELLYLVLNQFRKALEELIFIQVTLEQLPERMALILRDLWQTSTIDFVNKYYISKTEIKEQEVSSILLQSAEIIQFDILEKIPFTLELFAYLLFDQPLIINNISYRLEAPETLERVEIILHNLITQIANGVIQIFLNDFTDIEIIKHNLYKEGLASSREIARFRNNLSWRYRQEKYFGEPKLIFESQHRLFYFQGNNIQPFLIYAPRQGELRQLRGIPWLITMAWEFRDAIAPRLRSLIAFVGNGLVYVLTKVIGRGIGLIGRGIIQGIGNSLQETRYRKNK